MSLLQAFLSQINWWAIYTLIALVIGYAFMGLVLSLKDGTTELEGMGKWILETFLPMLGGYLLAVFIAAFTTLVVVNANLAPAYTKWFQCLPLSIFAFLTAMLVGKIKAQLQEIFPWIPDIPVLEAGTIAKKKAAIAAKAKPAAARPPT
jgi:hypothetical protein